MPEVIHVGVVETLGDPKVKVTFVEDNGPEATSQAVAVTLTLPPAKSYRVSSRVRSLQHPPQPERMAEGTRATAPTPRSAVST